MFLPVGSPPTERFMRGQCNVDWVAVAVGGLDGPILRTNLFPYQSDPIVLLGDFDSRVKVSGELDLLAGENVGQTYRPKRIVRVCRAGLQLPPPEQLLPEFDGGWGHWVGVDCSLPSLLTWQLGAVDARSLVLVMAANPEPSGGHRK